MSDWFLAFRTEAEKHDGTKWRLNQAVELLREVHEDPSVSDSDAWFERVATFLGRL